jgi:hypothetical protein
VRSFVAAEQRDHAGQGIAGGGVEDPVAQLGVGRSDQRPDGGAAFGEGAYDLSGRFGRDDQPGSGELGGRRAGQGLPADPVPPRVHHGLLAAPPPPRRQDGQ